MKNRVLLPVVGALLCCCTAAQADLKYTEVTTFEDGGGDTKGMGQMTMTTNKWFKKELSRSETVMSVGPMQIKNADIEKCETKETTLVDDDLKMYAVVPTMPGMAGMPRIPGMGGDMPGMPKPDKKEKGTSSIEVKVENLGKETVAGQETIHYKVNMKTTSTGCAGDGTSEMIMEAWVADIRMPSPCQEVDYKTGVGQMVNTGGCEVTSEFKGDVDAMSNVYKGLMMRMKMTMPKMPTVTKEITMLSQAELDDAPFTVPADWKKVSEKQLQEAKQKAMMKRMMEGMGGMPGMGDE